MKKIAKYGIQLDFSTLKIEMLKTSLSAVKKREKVCNYRHIDNHRLKMTFLKGI